MEAARLEIDAHLRAEVFHLREVARLAYERKCLVATLEFLDFRGRLDGHPPAPWPAVYDLIVKVAMIDRDTQGVFAVLESLKARIWQLRNRIAELRAEEAEELARQRAEEAAEEAERLAKTLKQRAVEEAAEEAERLARLQAEEAARLRAEEAARLQAEEAATLQAEEAARLQAERLATLQAEEAARLQAEEADAAEKRARLKAEEAKKAEKSARALELRKARAKKQFEQKAAIEEATATRLIAVELCKQARAAKVAAELNEQAREREAAEAKLEEQARERDAAEQKAKVEAAEALRKQSVKQDTARQDPAQLLAYLKTLSPPEVHGVLELMVLNPQFRDAYHAASVNPKDEDAVALIPEFYIAYDSLFQRVQMRNKLSSSARVLQGFDHDTEQSFANIQFTVDQVCGNQNLDLEAVEEALLKKLGMLDVRERLCPGGVRGFFGDALSHIKKNNDEEGLRSLAWKLLQLMALNLEIYTSIEAILDADVDVPLLPLVPPLVEPKPGNNRNNRKNRAWKKKK